MDIEKITRHGVEFAVLPMNELRKLMDDAEMLADVGPMTRRKPASTAARMWIWNISREPGPH